VLRSKALKEEDDSQKDGSDGTSVKDAKASWDEDLEAVMEAYGFPEGQRGRAIAILTRRIGGRPLTPNEDEEEEDETEEVVEEKEEDGGAEMEIKGGNGEEGGEGEEAEEGEGDDEGVADRKSDMNVEEAVESDEDPACGDILEDDGCQNEDLRREKEREEEHDNNKIDNTNPNPSLNCREMRKSISLRAYHSHAPFRIPWRYSKPCTMRTAWKLRKLRRLQRLWRLVPWEIWL